MKKIILLSLLMSLSMSSSADFQKMSQYGEKIALDSENWSCVVDDKNSLVWEVKSDKKGVQNALNTYTWFDGKSQPLKLGLIIALAFGRLFGGRW